MSLFFVLRLRKSVVFPWIVAFLILNLLVTQDGEKNPMSRFAALRAIAEQGTFRIDDYKEWTIDWAQGPDGHYYSNKPPGTILLAVPVFWVLDKVSLLWERDNFDERGLRNAPGYFHKTALSFLLQALPFALLTLFFCEAIAATGASLAAQHFLALALLFGQTASLFMNSWFGHGFAAVFVLWAAYEWWKARDFRFGLALGCALLCEYQMALLLPFLLLLPLLRERGRWSWVLPVTAGGIAPAILWVWYHTSAFGSPFATPMQYYNPAFFDMAEETGNIMGVLSGKPRLDVLWELAFGPSRGILFTQPWVYAVAVGAIFLASRRRLPLNSAAGHFTLLLGAGTLLVLVFNSMIGSWNGGYTAGPRYLSFLFPLWAVLGALFYDRLTVVGQAALWIGLCVALLFRALVYGTTILIPNLPLWPWMAERYFTLNSGTPWLRLGVFLFMLAAASYWSSSRKYAKAI